MTDCCEPRDSTLFNEQVHTHGCTANHAGLRWYGPLPPAIHPPLSDVEEREAAMRRHPARYKRTKPFCTGYRTVCPSKGCVKCLF